MTRWTEHVKSFAKEHDLSYGCAMTNPLCKSSYHQQYPKAVKSKEPKEPKAKEPKAKKAREKEIIFSQAAKDMMKGDIEFFTEMASSPDHLDALLNDPTIYFQGPEMKAFTRAAVLDNWAGQGRERQLMAAEDRPSKNPKQVLFPASQAFIPLEEAPDLVSNIMIKKPKKKLPKPVPRKRVPKVTAEEAMFEMLREEMPDVPRQPVKPKPKPKSKKLDISKQNYKSIMVDLDEMNKIEERKLSPVKFRTITPPDFEGTVKERVAKRKTAAVKEKVAERKRILAQFIPLEETYPDIVPKKLKIKRPIIPLEEAYPDIVPKNITITKPKPKRKPRAPPKGITKKQEEHDYNVSMFAQYFPEDEAFIEANVDKSKSQLKPLAVKYKVDPNEEFLFMALLKARKRDPSLKGKGIGRGILKTRAEDTGGLTHIYPLSRGHILKLMRE